MDAGIPCAVPEGHQSTLCLPDAVRLSDRDLSGYTTIRVPESLKGLRAKYLAREDTTIVGPRVLVLSRGRRGSEVAVVGTRPGYGQPGVDLGPTLEERVAAVEQHQSREFAALMQEVAILRAQVAQASQTASDISVNVGGRVARLAQRVYTLEQRFAPPGASGSGQPS
ncbi:hypothetical protein PHYSODRAFT_253381 [Phytophthora sojae]|uniref:Uncharacterized protein n=1 Tax=Phytophthora sojae (strain P6497) TaxID=1094619 RepID=G4Z7B2_PHYSP|nr:hypothetical protein PHYSODRAFT_253381 [Phytophthora sojae]EGZ19620.1 hypothetical protein PHYSODRAFT_253381 [Phytophthora sojae]|eukprot:XP_009522337.1 hypothetical protein PHYSODRAFT_253381 [Phytophthora sojae]